MDLGKTHPVGRVVNLDGKCPEKTCKMLSELNELKEEITMRELNSHFHAEDGSTKAQPKL